MHDANLKSQLTTVILKLTISCFLASLLIFNLGRIALFVGYGSLSDLTGHLSYYLNDLYYAIRLDLKTTAVWVVLIVLAAYPVQKFLPEGTNRFFLKVVIWYFDLYLFLCVLMTIIGVYYFAVYGNYIDVFIFQFLVDGNGANVAKSIYSDFSLFKFALLLFFGFYLAYLLRQIFLRKTSWQITQRLQFPVWIMSFLVVAVLARGAVIERPLSKQRAILSPDRFSNQIVSNGVMALYVARDQFGNDDISYLDADGEDIEESFRLVYHKTLAHAPQIQDFSMALPDNRNTESHPSVVVSLMESFGSLLLQYDSPGNDVLGHLRKHFQDDYLFLNFLSEGDDTVPSLERLITNHAYRRNLSQTRYRNVGFASSVATFFKSQGYRTIFITGGKKNWSDFDGFLPAQGFDEIYDEYTILEQVPGSRRSWAWGVYDEYLYQYAYKLLASASDQPLFIFLLTMSNHSPYDTPEDYAAYPLDVDAIAGVNPHLNAEETTRIVESYQYANDSLGRFMDSIKSDSKLADETIVAATGDHYLRYLFNYRQFEPASRAEVPFYLYLPVEYSKNIAVDTTRVGSHKDIFPTIVNRIFSGVEYYSFGNDLLAGNPQGTTYFGYNVDYVMGPDGAFYERSADGNSEVDDKPDSNGDGAVDEQQVTLFALVDAYVGLKRYFSYLHLKQ